MVSVPNVSVIRASAVPLQLKKTKALGTADFFSVLFCCSVPQIHK